MFNTHLVSGLPTQVCWQEYQRVVPFLKDTLMEQPKHVNVGTIGHVDHGRSAVSACISGALGTLPKNEFDWVALTPHQEPLVLIHASVGDNIKSLLANGRNLSVGPRHLDHIE